MKKLLALILVCLMLATLSASAFADTQNGELLDIAQVMVKAAMNKAEEINVPMVITVMDMDGNVVLFHRMKGSLLASMEISQNKAYTAVALKMPSETVKDLAIEGAELQSIAVQHAGRIVEFGGGFPIINPDGVQIGGIGVSGARILCGHFEDDLEQIRAADTETLSAVDGIGPVLADNIRRFFDDPATAGPLDRLLRELVVTREQPSGRAQILSGKTFVITGKVDHFENRDALKAYIQGLGGKAAGSVSSKTDYLINNDVTSNSSKNKKARELGIPILSEEDFLKMCEDDG